jgi:hypothetical protein
MQEWLLSKRILWYTSHGLFFECHTNLPSTDGQEAINAELAKPDQLPLLKLKASFHFANSPILDFWYRVLELYSASYLTNPNKDRILAIAGLSKEVREILKRPEQQVGVDFEAQGDIYLSGLWLSDLHHGLLWEEDHSAEPWTTRLSSAPSWSWSSLLTPIKWPERSTNVQRACKITGVCLQRQNHEHGNPEFSVNGTTLGATSELQVPIFDPTNMSACLHMQGKLCIVHIRGYLGTTENLHTAAFSTAYSPIPTDSQWRALCAPTRPELIVGWGSLEQLRMDEDACGDFGVAAYALHVSTRPIESRFIFKRAELVLDILLLEEVDSKNQVYRRLGVGRIADGYLIKDFHETEIRNIQII